MPTYSSHLGCLNGMKRAPCMNLLGKSKLQSSLKFIGRCSQVDSATPGVGPRFSIDRNIRSAGALALNKMFFSHELNIITLTDGPFLVREMGGKRETSLTFYCNRIRTSVIC